jgi:pimeloyl-ACP methyl ester carboxylesterase
LMHDLMPQSRLQIIANAAHLPPLEQPDATARALRAWLA